MSVDLSRVETPAAVVDLARVRANARAVVDYCAAHGLSWRPHVKTHKCSRIARLQVAAGARGLTVATPHEAEVMATVTHDLLLAYPPVGEARLERLMALPAAVDLRVALDSTEVLEPLARAARGAARTVGVLVEVDVGLRRVGVQGTDAALRLADAVSALDGVRYDGIAFYAGHVRDSGPEADGPLADLSRTVAGLRDALAARGLAPTTISGGTTPTLWRSHEIEGLTEVRAGTCIFNDRNAVAQGAADEGALAYTVLATVVSTAVEGRAAVDAGSKALAKEPPLPDGGFGALNDRPEVRVVALSEEHGMLDLTGTDWRPRVGERVRIVPNHVCVSVNLQDRLLIDAGEGAVESWPLDGRGRVTGAG